MTVHDEELIHQLRAELDELTAGIPSAPPPWDPAVEMAKVVVPHQRGHRRRVVVLAAAMVALVLGVGALVAFRDDGDAVGSQVSVPVSASDVATIPAASVGSNTITTLNSRPQVDVSTSTALTDAPYLLVGESVMLGAKPLLESHGLPTLAEVSKGPSWTLAQIRAFKTTHHITNGLVIQLGTNGFVTAAQYEEVLAELADVPRVVVMTVKADRPWIAGNNEVIRSLPLTHPNVVVLDWEARSVEVADHLSSDGIHLADDQAKVFFTNQILEALGLPT